MNKYRFKATISFQHKGKVMAENEEEATDIIAQKIEDNFYSMDKFIEIEELEEIEEKI
jgi:hypothetical protein